MNSGFGEQDARLLLSHGTNPRAGARAGTVQLVSATLGAAFALLTGCAAIALACLGALVDALRFAQGRGHWFLAAGLAAALLLVAALAWSWSGTHPAAAPWMIAFGAIGLACNAASVLAAFPHRVREFGGGCASASSWAFVVLIVAGAVSLVGAVEIPLVIVVAPVATALALGVVMEARSRS